MSKAPLSPTDPYNLSRFVDAQESIYEDVSYELRAGRKRSHWMWFVFPQIAGLGQSSTAQRFSVATLSEAKAYLVHPILGVRLAECTKLTLEIEGKSAQEIFGDPDWMKFRSSMTLFAEAAGGDSLFSRALAQFFHAEPDASTLSLLARARSDERA